MVQMKLLVGLGREVMAILDTDAQGAYAPVYRATYPCASDNCPGMVFVL
jgi:hypothetical protein